MIKCCHEHGAEKSRAPDSEAFDMVGPIAFTANVSHMNLIKWPQSSPRVVCITSVSVRRVFSGVKKSIVQGVAASSIFCSRSSLRAARMR